LELTEKSPDFILPLNLPTLTPYDLVKINNSSPVKYQIPDEGTIGVEIGETIEENSISRTFTKKELPQKLRENHFALISFLPDEFCTHHNILLNSFPSRIWSLKAFDW
jgi:hypothetical protein